MKKSIVLQKVSFQLKVSKIYKKVYQKAIKSIMNLTNFFLNISPFDIVVVQANQPIIETNEDMLETNQSAGEY